MIKKVALPVGAAHSLCHSAVVTASATIGTFSIRNSLHSLNMPIFLEQMRIIKSFFHSFMGYNIFRHCNCGFELIRT